MPDAPTVAYPTVVERHPVRRAAQDAAQLIKADLGTDVVAIDSGSWDLHTDYGTLGWGTCSTTSTASPSRSRPSSTTSATLRSGSPW